MGTFNGESLTTNIDKNKKMADELELIINKMVTKIEEIDSTIEKLVANGLKGSAIETASKNYIENRKVLGTYVQAFARMQLELEANAERNRRINEDANSAATAKMK